ncbi:hypothetical protein [Aeoliella sp.]|uniref:hypothetical protein n=1 Tax=Aeoliella sp. TaxID=2795800 RepID=UPI003CCBD08D
MRNPSTSQVLGTIFGSAVGDAMGAPFEGLWGSAIPTAESLLGKKAGQVSHPKPRSRVQQPPFQLCKDCSDAVARHTKI